MQLKTKSEVEKLIQDDQEASVNYSLNQLRRSMKISH